MILYNAIETPDGTILESTHRHDYKTYIDTKSNEEYMVDGGNDYLRRSVNKVPYVELSKYCTTTTEITTIRKYFKWGTYGKNGDQPREDLRLMDLSNEHIGAILRTQTHISELVKSFFERELNYRQKNRIIIFDKIILAIPNNVCNNT